MGNACCKDVLDDIITNKQEFKNIKITLFEEYKTYLFFLNELKKDLCINNCQTSRKLSNNLNIIDISGNNDNITNENNDRISKHHKMFYLIPSIWLEDWEKRVEIILEENKYKTWDISYRYKNEDIPYKFNFQLISESFWLLLVKNKLYNIDKRMKKTIRGVICNNLIIIIKKKYIEIFFFEKESDIFLSNLLFYFEEGIDERECKNLTKLLQVSPIQEILGNMHYNQLIHVFKIPNKKITMYNKTRKINESIKQYRIKEFMALFGKEAMSPGMNINEKIDYNDKEYFRARTKESRDSMNKSTYRIISSYNECKNSKIKIAKTINSINPRKVLFNISQTNNNNNVSNPHKPFEKTCLFKSCMKKDLLFLKKKNTSNLSEPDFNYSSINYDDEYEKSNNLNISTKHKSKNDNINNVAEKPTVDNEVNINISKYNNCKKYFNSFLYCLYNIKELTSFYLQSYSNEKNLNNSIYFGSNNFSKGYYTILKYLQDNSISTLKQFHDFSYNDLLYLTVSKTFTRLIQKFLDILHNELNSKFSENEIICENEVATNKINSKRSETNSFIDNEPKLSKSPTQIPNQKLNSSSFIQPFEDNDFELYDNYDNFMNYYRNCQKSIVFNLFYGIKETKKICIKCGEAKSYFEIFNTIDFITEDLINYFKDKVIITIENCLEYYKRIQLPSESSFFHCEFCQELQSYKKANDIWSFPKIIIFSFSSNDESDSKNFEPKLKIEYKQQIEISNSKYKIISLISRIDNTTNIESENNTKISSSVSYCENQSDKKWYLFDDNNEVIIPWDQTNKDKIFPFVLFYKKILTG